MRFCNILSGLPDTFLYIRERSLMMSDGGWGYEMTPKNWTLKGKNRTFNEDKVSQVKPVLRS